MLPPSFDTDRALSDVHWLVQELGPRVHETTEERVAVKGIMQRLQEAGWNVELRHGSPVACRGDATTLFLAHIDSVHQSPGAVDNAAAVAILLELARSSQARDLCLGFPIGEEAGLIGSRSMAADWQGPPLQLVVSLDLIGTGTPTGIDLNESWGTSELTWLTSNSDIDIPILHRIFGRALPQWRSDHGPFAANGLLAFQIKTRGESPVFPRYHQRDDTAVHPPSIELTAAALENLARAGPPTRGAPDPALPIMGWVLPGTAVWSIIGLGFVSGIPGITRLRNTLSDAFRLVPMVLLASVLMWVFISIGFPVAEAERTAANVVGHSATGWWNAAPWALAAAWVGWLLIWRLLPGQGHPAFVAAGMSIPALMIDPLAALPFSAAALLVRVHPLMGLLPAALFLRPDTLRELSFWGLISPWMWPLFFVFTWIALGTIRKQRWVN